MKSHDFNEKVRGAESWEEKLKNKLAEVLFAESVKRIPYDLNRGYTVKMQKDGIDGVIHQKTVTFDVKVRDFYSLRFQDILIETVSVVESNKPGWFYYTKSNFIVYTWKNEKGTNLKDGYFIFIQNSRLRDWFEENRSRYPVKHAMSTRNGYTWRTENVAVPIKDFPSGTIMRFNPHLSLELQQINLLDFAKV